MKGMGRIVAFCLIILVLVAGWIWRYCTMNAQYKSSNNELREVYSMGEIVPFGTNYTLQGLQADGYSLRVDSFTIVNYDGFLTEIGLDLETTNNVPEKLALVYITLFNDESTADGVMLTDFWLHGIDNYVSVDPDVLAAINPVLATGYGISLSPGTEYSLIIPFDLPQVLFGNDTWRNIEDYMFYLHITNYPTEKDILVK